MYTLKQLGWTVTKNKTKQKQRDRETDRQTDRQTERQRQRQRQRQRRSAFGVIGIAIAMTGHWRPSFYTHSVPASPPDCLCKCLSPNCPLLLFIRWVLLDSVFFSNISHMKLSDVLLSHLLFVCSYMYNCVMYTLGALRLWLCLEVLMLQVYIFMYISSLTRS